MPTYGIKRKSTEEEWEVICSWNELQKILKEDEDLVQTLSTPSFAGASMTNLRAAGDNWKDLLNKIKKGSGEGNTINT